MSSASSERGSSGREPPDRTVSAGMAPETRQLLDRIRRLAQDGWSPQAIAAELDLTEGGVRNVLALGQDVYAAGAHATAQLPEVDSFLKSWGKTSTWRPQAMAMATVATIASKEAAER